MPVSRWNFPRSSPPSSRDTYRYFRPTRLTRTRALRRLLRRISSSPTLAFFMLYSMDFPFRPVSLGDLDTHRGVRGLLHDGLLGPVQAVEGFRGGHEHPQSVHVRAFMGQPVCGRADNARQKNVHLDQSSLSLSGSARVLRTPSWGLHTLY